MAMVGLSEEAFNELTELEREAVLARARLRLDAHRPDYVIDSTADLIGVVDEISERIASGQRPLA